MKKILLLTIFSITFLFLDAQPIAGLGTRTETVAAGTTTYTLCSGTGNDCGCTATCVGVVCETSQSGNCARSPQTLTLNIPAGIDADLTVDDNVCGQGLDSAGSGDGASVQGTNLIGSDLPFSSCFFTETASGTITITLDANRIDECLSIEVVAVANGGTGGGGVAGCLTPLPVEYISYTAKAFKESEVILNWATASELNNSHFEIEHSIDGTNFRSIDEVVGNGTTQVKQEYNYTHTTPAFGTNYYRLKQVDFDGLFTYSAIRVVKIERTGKIVINPSAAVAEITIQVSETSNENSQIEIYDMVGRTVMISNFDGTLDTKTIDISNLQKGYYVVRVQAGSETFTERFMKMVD